MHRTDSALGSLMVLGACRLCAILARWRPRVSPWIPLVSDRVPSFRLRLRDAGLASAVPPILGCLHWVCVAGVFLRDGHIGVGLGLVLGAH